jgi:hypothetical protein
LRRAFWIFAKTTRGTPPSSFNFLNLGIYFVTLRFFRPIPTVTAQCTSHITKICLPLDTYLFRLVRHKHL